MNTARGTPAVDLNRLPTLPKVLLELIEAVHDPGIDFDRLAAIIRADATLCARLLTIVGTARYAQFNDTRDLNRVLLALGLHTVRSVAMTAAVQQFFAQLGEAAGPWLGRLWRGSLQGACWARALARLGNYPHPEVAYLTGLLHRIGQVVLLRDCTDDYVGLLDGRLAPELLELRERALFGVTATEIGALVAEQWAPLPAVADAVRYQRRTADQLAGSSALVRIVNLAHRLSDSSVPRVQRLAQADALLGLGEEVLDNLQAEVNAEEARTADTLGLMLDGQDGVQADGDDGDMLVLARHVRDFALLGAAAAGHEEGPELDDLLVSVLRGAQTLFGFHRLLCLLSDSEDRVLHARAASWPAGLGDCELQLPRDVATLLVNQALAARRPLGSHGSADTRSVVDEQLLRQFGTDRLLAVPLLGRDHVVGVLVAGLSETQAGLVENRLGLLQDFANMAATRIATQQHGLAASAVAAAECRAEQVLAVREAVHEASNPLSIIRNYLEVLRRRLDAEDHTRQHLELLEEETQRVTDVLLRLRDRVTAGDDTGDDDSEQAVDINAMLGGLLDLMRVSHLRARGINDALDLDERLPTVRLPAGRLKQVLVNLLRNASEAQPQGGHIGVRTRDGVNVNGEQYIEITITDHGPGIPAEVMEDLFAPVTSTKGQGHAGLGLAIVRNLTTELGGSIQCRSIQPRGTEFTLLVPRRVP